jgi:hypothetical protein
MAKKCEQHKRIPVLVFYHCEPKCRRHNGHPIKKKREIDLIIVPRAD